MKEHNLSWGDPIIVRQALAETLGIKYPISATSFLDMSYPPHVGNPKLIEQLKKQAERQSGHKPKFLIVTCGATGALNAALHALKWPNSKLVIANKRYFPLYPQIIDAAGMTMTHNSKIAHISLIDSPSNPEGSVSPFQSADCWDASYSTKTYSKGGHTPQKWDVMCGSLSKTLGLAGLRLGWVSTDNSILAYRLESYVTTQNAGPSTVSMSIAEEVLATLDQDKFEVRASGYLDSNREEMQKLLTKFDAGDVPTRGMFALLELGKTERKALEKANIKWLPGSMWGETDDWARLSLGQSREVIRSAVKAALK